ncbi:MAG: hypothetical protein HFF39_02910 [Lawsonibacter sp.]|nr:hypothetical protein [Lawsonibacter sp.]
MTAIEIARRMAALGQKKDACQAYELVLHQSDCPEEKLEAALYTLQSGGDYKVAYTCFLELYNQGLYQEDCLSIMTQAFYEPNVKRLKSVYEKNCKLLSKYPYLFRKDFLPFDELPIRFYPYDDQGYLPFFLREGRFGEYINVKKAVISRNFFHDLENPILARDVFSQYELEYLYDNVRKSEYVARENHVYLHYPDWSVFCSYLQCLNMKRILDDKKIVFLIGDELGLYPIDFKARFGIDYSQYQLKPAGIREINRMIWHTQLSSHNGGDFFNEIFDDHPNLISSPSLLLSELQETVERVRKAFDESNSSAEIARRLPGWNQHLVQELFALRDRTDKDILVAIFLSDGRGTRALDPASRIAPALFFQPHFKVIAYNIFVYSAGLTVLYSNEYEELRRSPIFQNFKYIKTFTPIRRITTSYGATVKFEYQSALKSREEWLAHHTETGELIDSPEGTEDEWDHSIGVVSDSISNRILNRSFMVNRQDRLYTDSVLVRFEDGKLNPKATFTALAAFLDLPYAESLTYCSLYGERDPESLKGNDLGFSPAAIYRTYDEYANDEERYFIEYFMRDIYEYCGYDFHYYDGKPMDEARAEELISKFTTLNSYIRKTWREFYFSTAKAEVDGVPLAPEQQEKLRDSLTEKHIRECMADRLQNAKLLLGGLRFVNKNGQPLQMMPRLKLDPALLEQPLYH